jgi:serine/threonine protein phosphatase 1
MPNLTYAIGDLHGRMDVLTGCLERIAQHRGGNPATIVFLGDFIDRGPHNKQVVERLMAGPDDDAVWQLICGNHEEMAIMAHHDPDSYWAWWCKYGGLQTSMGYGGKIPRNVLAWFAKLPHRYVDKYRYFVHAGVDPRKGPNQTNEDNLWVRHQRDFETPFYKYVVHGHTPHLDGPVVLKTRCNLDTGIYQTGVAAIAVFDDAIPGPPIDMLMVRMGYARD